MGYVLKYRAARPYQNYLRVIPPPPRALRFIYHMTSLFSSGLRHVINRGSYASGHFIGNLLNEP